MKDIELELLDVLTVLRPAATEIYGTDDVRRLREEMPILTGDALRALNRFCEIESHMCSLHMGQVTDLATSFYNSNRHHMPDWDRDDYINESLIKVMHAMAVYDGRTKFITLLYSAVKRHLLDEVKRRRRAKRGFAYTSNTLEAAKEASYIEEQTDVLALDRLHMVMDQLPEIHRDAVMLRLSGDTQWVKEFQAKHVNPDTQKPYSRQAVHNFYDAGIKTLRAAVA